MERLISKYVERIRVHKAKGRFKKAWSLVEEARDKGLAGIELSIEIIGLSFQLATSRETLAKIKPEIDKHPFYNLFGGKNRDGFLRLIHEHPECLMALTDHLLSLKNYDGFIGWFSLSDEDDQQWLIRSWLERAEKERGPRAAALKAAVGASLFVSDNWEDAWEYWLDALQKDPALLKKIMAFCNGSSKIDKRLLTHRIKLIQLIAASGKMNETLSLLLALGMESKENAERVLAEMPNFMGEKIGSRESLELRFNLALFLQDPETLYKITADLVTLTESELFDFKKQAMLKIQNQYLRRSVLLEFARIYINKMNWENASLLLETMFQEEPNQEIVSLMEEVLTHYPVLTQLHFTVGKYYLETGQKEKANSCIKAIQEVPEYRQEIQRILENQLVEDLDVALAGMLLRLLEPGSHKAGLIACLIVMVADKDSLVHLGNWTELINPGETSPFRYLALINAYCLSKKYDESYRLLCEFLGAFPELSPEAVRPAELLVKSHQSEFGGIISLIEEHSDRLKPKTTWLELKKWYTEATKKHRTNTPNPTKAEARKTQEPQSIAKTHPELNQYFKDFRTLVESGDWQAAILVAEKTVDKFPEKSSAVINHLEKLAQDHPHDPLWVKSILAILLKSKDYAHAIKFGHQALSNPLYQAELPEIYQALALAFEGIGHEAEALRFFCLSSRQARFYEVNSKRLETTVLPKHPHLLKEVLHLALINEDQEVWERLMKAWYKHQPEDVDNLIKAQTAFTNQVGTPKSILDLSFWYLQAGKIENIHKTLNRIDLRDPEIRDSLVHIANLVNLKYPEDPKAKFLLGKYYLVHQEISCAVDTFRNLAKDVPVAAEPIYQYLRNYMKKNPDTIDIVYLYGLLIRFALAHGSPLSSIRLLDEFGDKDREGAESLIEGVYRVIGQSKDNQEALYKLAKLQFKWGAHEKVLLIDEENDLGTHMAEDRLQWFLEIRKQLEFEERANLRVVNLLFETRDFDRCRKELTRIKKDVFKREALGIYEKLTERFPDQIDLWRDAGWAAFPQEPGKVKHFFERVFEKGHQQMRLEAFAFLSELGTNPDFEKTRAAAENEDELFANLKDIHRSIREKELSYWEENKGQVPVKAMEWLLANGQMAKFENYFEKIEELKLEEASILGAKHLHAQGHLVQAAWRLTHANAPVETQQSFFLNADLVERSVLIKKPGSRLAPFLREAFLENYGKAKLIQARFSLFHQWRRPVS